MADRDAIIIRASAVNIAGNVALAGFKALVGVLAGSIAITLDAVNNFSDAISSIVTILGTRLASRPADHKHPFGYGRMEYLATLVIAALVLSAGGMAFVGAVQAIFKQATPDYSVPALVIVGVACVAKVVLGLFLRSTGQRVDSGTLVASGLDALGDAVISLGTLIAAIVFLVFHINVEAWIAAIIALLIVKNGVEMLLEVISKVLGERGDPGIVSRVEECARSVDGVEFASGLVMQDYGPDRMGGSLFVTVDAQMSVADFDAIAREVQRRVQDECGIELTCIGVYPADKADSDVREIRSSVGRIVWGHDQVLELRGLHVDMARHIARFDAVVGFGERDLELLRSEIMARCEAEHPGWTFDVRILPDVGD